MLAFRKLNISLRFPEKLWKIVHDSKTNAIKWNKHGNSILIDRKEFHKEYLNAISNPFKTTRFQSFIRQLNLYGFRKVKNYLQSKQQLDQFNINIQEFFHVNFIRGRYDLLVKIVRQTGTSGAHTTIKNGHLKRVDLCQMALSNALEKVSVKLDFQAYNVNNSVVKNEVIEAVDNIVKVVESECELYDWESSNLLKDTSNKYSIFQSAYDTSDENSELPSLENITEIDIEEIQENKDIINTNQQSHANNSNEEDLTWNGIVYNEISDQQYYAMYWANEKNEIDSKVITESLDEMVYESSVYYDHRYSIPLIWN